MLPEAGPAPAEPSTRYASLDPPESCKGRSGNKFPIALVHSGCQIGTTLKSLHPKELTKNSRTLAYSQVQTGAHMKHPFATYWIDGRRTKLAGSIFQRPRFAKVLSFSHWLTRSRKAVSLLTRVRIWIPQQCCTPK